MASKKQGKQSAQRIRRLAQNQYVQTQLRDAALALGKVYQRVATRRGQAVEDKKLYDHLREAAVAIRNAASVQRRRPAPPPKHRGRKLIMAAAVSSAGVLLLIRGGSNTDSNGAAGANSSDDVAGATTTSEPSELAAQPTGDS